MKKKKKKFESLKSVLVLLQQIQANEFGEITVWIHSGISTSIHVTTFSKDEIQ